MICESRDEQQQRLLFESSRLNFCVEWVYRTAVSVSVIRESKGEKKRKQRRKISEDMPNSQQHLKKCLSH
jgi:hypothetical protein